MYEVSKCAPQEALRDLDKAFNNFYRGLKEGTDVGFPKFKKRGEHDSFRLTGTIKIKGKAIQLPRLGTIRLKEVPKIRGRILSATVSREADRWFVSISDAHQRKKERSNTCKKHSRDNVFSLLNRHQDPIERRIIV